MSEKNRFLCLALGVVGLLLLGVGIQTPGANAAQEKDSLAGKTLRIIVPYAPGGAFDRLARFVGLRIGDHIPGNPSVIVQNMTGGGGAIATNYLYNVAPKDGTAMAILNPTLILPQLIGQKEMRFDMAKFNWVGSLQRVNVACMARKEAGIKHLPDILGSDKQQLLFGATEAGASNFIWPVFLKDLGAQIGLVTGYAGAAPIYLALQRGEVHGVCSTWDAMRITAQLLHRIGAEDREKAITTVFVQTGNHPAEDLPSVPLLQGFLKTERQRVLAAALSAPDEVMRAFALPPGVPTQRVGALRQAFQKVLEDAQLKEMTKKSGDELAPSPGEHVEKVMRKVITDTPKESIAEIKRLFGG
jgi:tripartite-type tricarboxylate transporter receptor subunit TctC